MTQTQEKKTWPIPGADRLREWKMRNSADTFDERRALEQFRKNLPALEGQMNRAIRRFQPQD